MNILKEKKNKSLAKTVKEFSKQYRADNPLVDPIPYEFSCPHQFFEIKKIAKVDRKRKKLYDGILIKCALCGEQKELWEDEK
jgi:formylmethanofuran dehydrogenase subunit E